MKRYVEKPKYFLSNLPLNITVYKLFTIHSYFNAYDCSLSVFNVNIYINQRTAVKNFSGSCLTSVFDLSTQDERQNSKKGFEKNEHACSMEGVFWSRILVPAIFKGGRPNPENSKVV